jgi:putative hydrolase of the HAD superfamily
MTPRWVVFDYGEVISHRTAALPALAATMCGDTEPDVAAFERAYWAYRDAYDRGMPDLAYWQAIGGQLGFAVDEPTAAELTSVDVRGWLRLEAETVALVEQLHGIGVPLALLSNAPSAFGREVERQPWSGRFEHLMFSGDLGVAKPDAEIWAALLDLLDARPADCMFLDDRQVNVDGARAAGLAAMRWTGAQTARAAFRDLGLFGSC